MDFDENNLVLVESLTKEEAKAFVVFLASEILRHRDDIVKAKLLARGVIRRFDLVGADILGVIADNGGD